MSFQVARTLATRQISSSSFLNSVAPDIRPAKLVVGVLVFSNDQVLLLQRAATERHYPNIWELPSGKVESQDATLLHAAARECMEETGLTVTGFVADAKSFEYSIAGRGSTLQLNFNVEVRAGDSVIIDPSEHKSYRWCAGEEIKDIGVTDATRETLKDAFQRRHQPVLQMGGD